MHCLNLRAKRTVPVGTVSFECNLRPSMKIRATVHIQLKIHDIAPVAKPVFVFLILTFGKASPLNFSNGFI